MSETTGEPIATEPGADSPAPVAGPSVLPPIACPRCGAEVGGDQSWCLECGLAARTHLAPTPNWRVPLGVAAAVGVAAIAALVVAFLVLTGDNAPVPPATSTAAPAATAPAVTTTAPAATPPAATTTTPPPATTTIPPAAVPPGTPTTTAPAAPTGAG